MASSSRFRSSGFNSSGFNVNSGLLYASQPSLNQPVLIRQHFLVPGEIRPLPTVTAQRVTERLVTEWRRTGPNSFEVQTLTDYYYPTLNPSATAIAALRSRNIISPASMTESFLHPANVPNTRVIRTEVDERVAGPGQIYHSAVNAVGEAILRNQASWSQNQAPSQEYHCSPHRRFRVPNLNTNQDRSSGSVSVLRNPPTERAVGTPENVFGTTPERAVGTPERVFGTPERVFIWTPERVFGTPERVVYRPPEIIPIETPERVVGTPEISLIETPKRVDAATFDNDQQGSRYDGRTHSLNRKKYGPYQCPKCRNVFSKSQAFAGHMTTHYKHETKDEKTKRRAARFMNKNLSLVPSADGLTLVPLESGRRRRRRRPREGTQARNTEPAEEVRNTRGDAPAGHAVQEPRVGVAIKQEST